MPEELRRDAARIIDAAIRDAQPEKAVRRALEQMPEVTGRMILFAIGKAAWPMAAEACRLLQERVQEGIVITKYGHARGELPGMRIFEAGHPVPDANTYTATEEAIRLAKTLGEGDLALLLLSGGGSALFEKPLVPADEMAAVTKALLAGGADIAEINAVRKHLSAVKGGRFAELCAPARVYCVALSDVLGDRPDVIASGPAYPDASTSAEALATAEKYGVPLSAAARSAMRRETPKALPNADTRVTGGVRHLCAAAERECRALGYDTIVLTDCLCCTARDAGSFLASIAKRYAGGGKRAFIAGGETVVHVTGAGLGGRNQEIALAAAVEMDGAADALLFSVGSDGTDGPTDAAGGMADETTCARMCAAGVDARAALEQNDSYHALKACGDLIVTGPTGTNVNDLTVLLCGAAE